MSRDPSNLSPRDAMKRYIDRSRSELSESSASTYYYRLKLWVEWCEEQGIEEVSELSGWVFEQYEAYRSGEDISASALHNEMETLKWCVEYLERIEAVDDDLAEKVHVPRVPEQERSRDKRLSTEQATRLLEHYRDSEQFGNQHHALLEVAWHTGARLGSIRALDLRDFHPEEQYLEFVHRPSTDTPLKNKLKGERMVSLQKPVVRALQDYVRHHRHNQHDEHGRSPLFTSRKGRPSTNTVRTWCYLATHPCVAQECPHGREMATCDFRHYHHASKCPSARAPHHVRTGSISWHRDRGVPKEVTAERVNASERVIDRYYDKSTKRERMNLRRRPHIDKLGISEEDDGN